MATEFLPNGSAAVMLGNEPVWTALDVFTWVAFGERRDGVDGLDGVLLPRRAWSRDWVCWPPQSLLAALNEIATGGPWTPVSGSHDEAFAAGDRAWAREVLARNGEDAPKLAATLAGDIERFRLAQVNYGNAKEEVHAAIRKGRLHLWARRAHGSCRPNHEAEPELLGPHWFTHQPREVDEGGWIEGSGDYKGPWWDEARFDAEQVVALWPERRGIGAFANQPQTFPNSEYIAPWVAASWRAFGTLDTPAHIVRQRSFDDGTDRLPDETRAEYDARQEDHRRFDGAEREVMDLLSSGRTTAKGLPPAVQASHQSARSHVDVPADTFLTREVAFTQDGKLISRLKIFARMFPPLDVRGSNNSPEFPLWHDLLIKAAGLREAWNTKASPPEVPLPFAPAKAVVPKPPCEYSEKGLAAWFVLRVRTWRTGTVLPTEAEDLEAARAQYGNMPRDRFRHIRREKTPSKWRKPGPRRPRD